MAKGYKGFAEIGRAADRRLKERDRMLKLYEKFGEGDTVEWETPHQTKEQGVIKSIFEKDDLTPLAHIVSENRKPVIPLEQLKLIKKGTTEKESLKKVTTMETKEPETTEKNKSSDKSLLVSDQWFKQNPSKILGEEYETTNRFNKAVTKVKGKMEDALQGIDVPTIDLPKHHVEALESNVKEPLEQFINEEIYQENVATVIKAAKKKQAENKLNQLEGKKEVIDLNAQFSFKDIMEQYNKGITEEEIKAWVWYKRKINGYNDETVILNKKNGWSDYVIPLGQVANHTAKWLKEGVICYYNGDFMPSVLYYAENIYKRQQMLLKEKEAIIENYGQEQYDRQWQGLENVKPPKLTLTDPVKQNRLFIKPTAAFANEIQIGSLSDGTTFNVYNRDNGKWENGKTGLIDGFKDWLKNQPKDDFKKSSDWNIIQFYLENKTPPRYYEKEEKLRMKQNAKQEGDAFFVKFLAEGLTREDQLVIEQVWNERYNGYVEINYFKIPVAFTCSSTFKNKPLFIRPAQREGIGFISVHGSGCIAYDVGVGKTMTAILSLAQALESGQCKRPFIVVPNQTYKNWLGELQGVIEKGQVSLTGVLPQYQVMDLYNLGESYLDQLRDKEGNIKSVPEYTISVLTYEGFNRLAFSDETWGEIGGELFEILNQGTEEEREKAKLFEKIEEMMGKGIKGASVNIEELGFDYLVVDEAHAMKKSFTQVKGEQKGDTAKRDKAPYEIKSGQPSMTALRGFMISQYILRNNNMRNVLLLTATPFTNSPLEIYSILALIGYQQLERSGVNNIKEFFDTYIKTSLQLVINAKLKPERKEIVMGFSNLIALQSLIFKFITYKTGEDANIQRPNKIVLPLMNQKVGDKVVPLPPEKQISTNLPLTATQADYMKDVESYVTGKTSLVNFCVNPMGFEEETTDDSKGESLNESNMSEDEEEGARILRGLSFARQLALSPYLYACNPNKNPSYEEYIDSSPKLKYVMGCIQTVKRFHENRKEDVSGQVIYMNSGVHFFSLIKEYLVKKIGYDEKEIGIIKSGLSAAKKEGIKEKFLAGTIKIIIGSASIKEGINLQNRSTVLYNCWLDWNPTDVKQLEGRIWRFGNRHANIRVVNPLMEDSVDTFIFQKLEEKTSRINEIWYRAGKTNSLNLEEFNPSELKSGLITDPHALAELILMEEREQLQDTINGLKNQQTVLEDINKARTDFNENIEHVKNAVNRYKPQKTVDKDGNAIQVKARTLETIFKIYKDYLDDENTETTYRDQTIYDTVRKANATITRGLEQVLEPKGFDINFDYDKVVGKINKEIEEHQKVLEERTGQEALNEKAQEIIQERIDKGYKPKTVKERVDEFASMNDKVLTELMVYDGGEAAQAKTKVRAKKGETLESAADGLDKIRNLKKAFSAMQERLQRIKALQAA
jgi:N12 class adenine-specific DNA methylase